jgi:hypothetical protein
MTFWNWLTLFFCALGAASAVMGAYFRGRIDTLDDRIAELKWEMNGYRGPRPVDGKIGWASLSVSIALSLLFIAMAATTFIGGK